MDTQAPTTEAAGIGHNMPSAFDALKDRVEELLALGNAWKGVDALKDEDQAKKAQDMLTRVKAELKDVETARKDEKRPHLDANKEIDARYNDTLKAPLEKIKSIMTGLITLFLQEQDRIRREEQRRKEEEALKALQDAEEKAKASDGTIQSELEAEAAQKAADDAVSQAHDMAKGTATVKGAYADRATSLRTYYSAEITDYDAALKHFADHPKVHDVIQQLANQWAISPEKRKTPIPGVKLVEGQRAA